MSLRVVFVCFALWDRVRLPVRKGDNSFTIFNGVFVLSLSVTHSLFIEGSIPCTNHEDIVVALVYNLFDVSQLFYVCCRKHLHACGDVTHV